MSVRANVETFRNIPIFSGCDPAHLQLLAFSAVGENFEPGSILVQQGQTGTAAYLVLSGQAEISTDDKGPLGEVGPGSFLGQVAMIGASPYSVTVRALDLVSTARIDRDLFLRVAQEFPEFGNAVLRTLARKLGTAIDELGEVRQLLQRARTFRSL
jgi:CRP/FNR family cyclic AMP-dependent transcriptional regulator